MRKILKALAILIILAAGGTGYLFLQFRSELHEAYKTADSYAISYGKPDIYIVDFIDYGCQFSQKLHPVLKEAIEKDGNILYIPRPVLADEKDEDGHEALLFLYAAGKQGAFGKVNEKLYEVWPVTDFTVLTDYAKTLGLDVEKIRQDMKTPEVIKAVKDNNDFFDLWSFKATPTVIFATEMMGTKAILVPQGKDVTIEDIKKRFEIIRGWF